MALCHNQTNPIFFSLICDYSGGKTELLTSSKPSTYFLDSSPTKLFKVLYSPLINTIILDLYLLFYLPIIKKILEK